MSLTLASRIFPLPEGTEFRSRLDRFGHLVVWPDQRSYRVAPRGSLRAVFEDRRVDVSPMFDGSVTASGAGQLLGLETAKRTAESPLGRVELELAKDAGLDGAGALWCAVLLEFLRLHASTAICGEDELPLRAHYTWVERGELDVVVTTLTRRGDFDGTVFAAPPPMPIFKPGELPPDASTLLWTDEQSRTVWDSEAASHLTFDNHFPLPVYVIVDGVPLMRVGAHDQATWSAKAGSHKIAFRDFFGDVRGANRTVEAPGRVALESEPPPAPAEASAAKSP